MDVLDLISNIGSNLSLFIGISFISLAEIVEILVEILCIFFENKKHKKSTKPTIPIAVSVKYKNIKRTNSL